MRTSNPMPTIQEVVNYWSMREDESGLGVDWSEAHERCWRCGYKTSLERCHIIPASLGGANKPSNLVLLCRRCHREAPNIDDPRFMWVWLRRTCVPFYDLYWTMRGIQEFQKMFGRLPFQGKEFKEISRDEAERLFSLELAKTTVHFGEGRINPATIAGVYARIEEYVTGRPTVVLEGSADAEIYFELMGWRKADDKG